MDVGVLNSGCHAFMISALQMKPSLWSDFSLRLKEKILPKEFSLSLLEKDISADKVENLVTPLLPPQSLGGETRGVKCS